MKRVVISAQCPLSNNIKIVLLYGLDILLQIFKVVCCKNATPCNTELIN